MVSSTRDLSMSSEHQNIFNASATGSWVFWVPQVGRSVWIQLSLGPVIGLLCLLI